MSMKQSRKEWVDALRSGEYKQGTGALRKMSLDEDNEIYCPWGVACDLYSNANPKSSFWEDDNYGVFSFNVEFPSGIVDISQEYPPRVVMEFFEIDDMVMNYIIDLSDTSHYTFDKIADFIEEGLSEYETESQRAS